MVIVAAEVCFAGLVEGIDVPECTSIRSPIPPAQPGASSNSPLRFDPLSMHARARRLPLARSASREQEAQRASRSWIAAAISSGASSAMKCPARVSRWSRSGAHAFHTPAAS